MPNGFAAKQSFMSNLPQIGPRGRAILTAVVETYIHTGEPVASQAISRQSGDRISSATVRNVMAELSELGLLEQPHTSAGRVPTAQAYRYYVEQLSGKAHISPEEETRISGILSGASDVEEFMERTSRVLSLVSSGVGLAIASAGPRNALEHIYFTRLGDHKILAVVVTRSGIVRDRVLRVQNDLSQADLELAAHYINENFRGWTMDDLRQEIARRVEQERSEYDRLMQAVAQLYKEGALAHEDPHPAVFVEGASNLVGREQDAERLQQMLKTLEEKNKIVELVSAYLDTKQEAVRVVIGLEGAEPHLRDLVLIGAPARVGGEVMGSLAVLGTPRLDYEHTITAVSYIARLFDQILNEDRL